MSGEHSTDGPSVTYRERHAESAEHAVLGSQLVKKGDTSLTEEKVLPSHERERGAPT